MAEETTKSQLVDVQGLKTFLANADERYVLKGEEGLTYTLTKNESGQIVLSGSDGSTNTVTDANTTYAFSETNHVLTITGSDGTSEEIQLGGEITSEAIEEALGFTPADADNVREQITMTYAEYQAAQEAGTLNPDAWYIVSDYPDASSGLTREVIISYIGYEPVKASDVPDELADLSDDASHRLVTDTEKAAWNGKAEISDIPDVSGKADKATTLSGYGITDGITIAANDTFEALEV